MPRTALPVVVMLALMASCGSGDGNGGPQITIVAGTPTPAMTNQPGSGTASSGSSPTVTATPDPAPSAEELLSLLKECLDSEGSTVTRAAAQIDGCLAPYPLGVVRGVVDGELPLLLVDVLSEPPCFETKSFLIWFDESWHVQSAEPFLEADPGSALNGMQEPVEGGVPEARARATGTTAGAELGVVQLRAGCGSGTFDQFLLLRLESDGWRRVYRSADDQRSLLGHAAVEFAGAGLDGFLVMGDSWFNPDGKNVFVESNPGPHRHFTQTWARAGDSYELAEERVKPSPYNTLVEFVYALGSGDDRAAAEWVAEPALVQAAIDAGLAKDLDGPQWTARCGDGSRTAPPPCTVRMDEGSATVDMVFAGDEWLVSAIASE